MLDLRHRLTHRHAKTTVKIFGILLLDPWFWSCFNVIQVAEIFRGLNTEKWPSFNYDQFSLGAHLAQTLWYPKSAFYSLGIWAFNASVTLWTLTRLSPRINSFSICTHDWCWLFTTSRFIYNFCFSVSKFLHPTAHIVYVNYENPINALQAIINFLGWRTSFW